tara:strand:+ start:877 stop:1074 length:198 start_codon:yes stop_codon:yes gene_type:complete
MKIGDTVKLKHITDFEGIILRLVEWEHDEYGESEMKIWKVFWYKHPYDGKPPFADEQVEAGLRFA